MPLHIDLSAVEALRLHEILEVAHRHVQREDELELLIQLKAQVKDYFLTEHKLALR
jgi:predicted metal-dependent peptidase